ncbi:unannotated protein [freshwater metagenome]|uniref:Unannotated protein n=1 Tax=freshwater metagenome TaxID=449393 RepID=A0A6J6MPL2_9ZZZZ
MQIPRRKTQDIDIDLRIDQDLNPVRRLTSHTAETN